MAQNNVSNLDAVRCKCFRRFHDIGQLWVQCYGHVSGLPTRSFSTPDFCGRAAALEKGAIERETLNKKRLAFTEAELKHALQRGELLEIIDDNQKD